MSYRHTYGLTDIVLKGCVSEVYSSKDLTSESDLMKPNAIDSSRGKISTKYQNKNISEKAMAIISTIGLNPKSITNREPKNLVPTLNYDENGSSSLILFVSENTTSLLLNWLKLSDFSP